jgi:hypothetical protein
VRVGSISPRSRNPHADRVAQRRFRHAGTRGAHQGALGLKNFDPCTILLNNDLSAGAPGILEDMHEQYLLPPLHAGWSVRRKSTHFKNYEEVAKRFGKMLGIDPWLINPMFSQCGGLDFAEDTGHGRLAGRSGRAADQGAPQVQGIRHQRKALCGDQGQQRHLRHGHHDRARRQGAGRAQPQDQEQDGRHQGRPAGQRRDHPGGCSRRSACTMPWPSPWST